MFGKLKDKLKDWAKNLANSTKEEVVEETQKKGKKAKKTKDSKKEKAKPEKKTKIKEVKEINLPQKFNVGLEKFEPDLDKLKEEIVELEKEEIKEVKKQELEKSKDEKQGFFSRITSKITKVKISEEDFQEYSEELEMLLLENNVALEVTEKIIQELKERIVGKELLKKEIEGEIKDSLKEIMEKILVEPFKIEEKIKDKQKSSKEPYVILFCGINGTGKTTTIAKIADSLKKQKISSVIAAGDTFRAASIEQLKKHGDKLGIPIISTEYGSDPAAVGFDAIQHAKKHNIQTVLIDTAGRMHTEKNLMKEIEKISKVTKPDIKIFVGESIAGNDSVEQIKSFDWAIGIDGIILTKADIDEKGGTALSLGYVTKKPILYLGMGQEYKDLEVFNKEKFIERLGL